VDMNLSAIFPCLVAASSVDCYLPLVISTDTEGAQRLKWSGEIPLQSAPAPLIQGISTTALALCLDEDATPDSVPEAHFPAAVFPQVQSEDRKPSRTKLGRDHSTPAVVQRIP
jgi:hypothetical protein